jgi:hypothetical protein
MLEGVVQVVRVFLEVESAASSAIPAKGFVLVGR